MINSSTEMMGVIAETYRKAPMVCGAEAKRRGVPLKTLMNRWPKQLKLAWQTVVTLHTRYASGDYRHDEMDVGVVESFCNYLIELHQTAGGHPIRHVKYKPEVWRAREPCTPNTYGRVLLAIQEQFG